MICKYMEICAFIFHGSNQAPFTAKMTRIKYCERSQRSCARYTAYGILDADLVPDELWPNEEIKILESMERKINETHKLQRKNSGDEV